MNFLKNFWKNSSTKAKAFVLSIFGSLLIILIISIISLLNQPKPYVAPQHVNISNWSENLTIPDSLKTEVEQQIWSEIKDEEGITPSTIYDATIRQDSVSKSDDSTLVLIDIEPLHYSFRTTITYNESKINQPYYNPGSFIECPYPKEVIFTDKKCPIGTPLSQLQRHLPHYQYLSDESTTFSVTTRTYDSFQKFSGEQYLAVSANSCGDQQKMTETNKLVKEWLKSLYLDPNDFHIEILDTCETQ